MDFPMSLPFQKPPDKPNPKEGIGLLSWSNDSQYIFTSNDNISAVLWVWDAQHLELAAILLHKEPIRAAIWDPAGPRIILCTGSTNLYLVHVVLAFCCPSSPFLISNGI